MIEKIENYYQNLTSLIESMNLQQFSSVVDLISSSIQNGCSIFIAGNGGSATTATHFSNDLIKVVSRSKSEGVVILSLSDNPSTLTAISNDNCFKDSYTAQLKVMMRPNDLLILFSASGNSENLVSAAEFAKQEDGKLVSITGFSGGMLKELSDYNIHVQSPMGEYEIVEDVHLSVAHLLSQLVASKL